MKAFFITFFFSLCISVSYSQTPIDALFKKYIDKDGVEISIDKIPISNDSAIKAPLSTILKTLTVRNDESDKKVNGLFQKILRDCNKILNRKEYDIISADKDDYGAHRAYKKEKGQVREICELEYDKHELTLTVTQISGLTKDM
jgi:hypothetical protein